jgi:hypothetical protein
MANNIEAGSGGGPAARAREGAEQIKDKALQRVEEAKERATSGKDKLSDRVRRVSSAIRLAGDDLRLEDDLVARYADRASERFERAADYLRTADPKQAVRDVEGFARREPGLFFGGAFLLGLAAARFLKSSQRSSWDRADAPWNEALDVELGGEGLAHG